jgi:hypothetical protein
MYDKNNDFNFAIVNFQYTWTCSNIPASSASGEYNLFTDSICKACSTYDQFLIGGRHWTDKLMLQGFLQSRLMPVFCKFCGRYNDLMYTITNFHWAICCLTFFKQIVRLFLAPRFWWQITPHSWLRYWAHSGCDSLLHLGTWSHLRYVRGSISGHSFLGLVIPTCISRLISWPV